MKKIITVLLSIITLSSFAQKEISKSLKVNDFQKIKISGAYTKVSINQGDKNRVTVSGSEDLVSKISHKIKEDELMIDMKEDGHIDFDTDEKLELIIQVKNLEEFDFSGVAMLYLNIREAKDFKFNLKSVGISKLNINTNSLSADIECVGKVVLKGNSKSAKLNINGLGSLEGNQFEVDYLTIENSGIGAVGVNANKEISIVSNGIGSVKWSGNAKIIKKEVNGLGSVEKH